MGKSDDITKLDRSIKDADIRMRTYLSNVEALTKELDLLSDKEKTLEDNVKCLKKNRIIAVAQEYKKAKDELERVRFRILTLGNDKQHFLKTVEDIKLFVDKTQKELDKLQNANDNVLQFRGKNG